MNVKLTKKPRIFKVKGMAIKDHGKIFLKNNEMISVVIGGKHECDITAKDWGMYLGPSLNGRLKIEGFKSALVINEEGRIYIQAVLKGKVKAFKRYLRKKQKNKIICWLDDWPAI